jgi:hypothetical protein
MRGCAGTAVALPVIMSSRPFLLAACVLSLASPAFAGNGARPARRTGKMKVSTVVDKTVDGVVVERKLFLRKGGSKRKAKEVTLESKAKGLERGLIISDQESAMPSSMTLKGRLIEKEGSYREHAGGAVITLVRPGAHHLSGEQGKRVYSGGRVRKVTRTKPVTIARRAAPVHEEPAHAAAAQQRVEPVEHRRHEVGAVFWDEATADWYHAPGGGSLSATPNGSTINIEASRDGRNVRWGVSRFALEEALEFGTETSENFVIKAEPSWVVVAPHERPEKAIALPRHEVEAFLDATP